MAEPSERDMDAAQRRLGNTCTSDLCRVRPTYSVETGEPDGGSYMHHHGGCLVLYHEDVARALAAAREEGRREGLEEAAQVCDARRERIEARYGRAYGCTAHEESMAVDACAEDIRALIGGDHEPR